MGDETDRLAAVPPWSDAMRRLRELVAQMTAAAQAVAVAGAKVTPPLLAQPLARYADQLLAVSSAVTNPLRRLLDEQQRLVEMMAEWAQQHRSLSEQIAEWADQQRRLSEQMVELARPLLDQSAMLESLQAEWSSRSPDSAPLTPGAKTAAKKAPARKAPAKKVPAPRRSLQRGRRRRARADRSGVSPQPVPRLLAGQLHVRPRLASMTIHLWPNIASVRGVTRSRRRTRGRRPATVPVIRSAACSRCALPNRCFRDAGSGSSRRDHGWISSVSDAHPAHERPAVDAMGVPDSTIGAFAAAAVPEALSTERSRRRPMSRPERDDRRSANSVRPPRTIRHCGRRRAESGNGDS